MRPVIVRMFMLLTLAGLAACAPAPAANVPVGVIAVTTTTGMIADVVRNVGGEHVQVTALMGAGVDPHLYRATESDVNALSSAQMIFYNGLHLEARMADVLEQISGKPVVVVAEALPAELIMTKEGYDAPDPHIWMDISQWALVAGLVRDELMAFDAANADDYRANAEAYIARLTALHAYTLEQVASIPAQQRVLVTAHDAFQYFGRAYGIEVFAPQGISTVTEAGVDDIRRTIDLVVERQIPAIFVETSVPPNVIDAIVEGAAARGVTISIGGSLYSDAMGDANTADGTYEGMLRHNVDTIVGALRGG
ncbi:MAG: zinc ABC transporter substrate-binding protein [Chloroflexi bacterium]|nr:zinc ABC transporter substrate-binding protein [Chloroflexota bacterium]